MPRQPVGHVKDIAGRKQVTRREARGGQAGFDANVGNASEQLSPDGRPLFRAGVHGFADTYWVLWPGT